MSTYIDGELIANDTLREQIIEPKFSRCWAMPNKYTFSIPPIRVFIEKYLKGSFHSVDPFAGNSKLASTTNDLNPKTCALTHLHAAEFLNCMRGNFLFDLCLFDPPYSPRQISECYKSIGLDVGSKETQNAALYKSVRDALMPRLTSDAVVLSFGWNTIGMGKKRGFEIIEIMLVCHGGAHNDTICIAEKRIEPAQDAKNTAANGLRNYFDASGAVV